VQLALKAGAEIYATAGSDEKRAYLKSLGVRYVMDSRTLDFAAEIMRLTGGEGVDVVLNSLTDDFIVKSLAVLKTGGRFLEIGKRGIWTHEQIDGLERNIQYHVIFLGEICQTNPALIQSMLQTVLADLSRGTLQLLPVRVFPLDRAADAFRYMARAKHIGKIVISFPDNDQAVNDSAATPLIQSNATYLITGGLGGLGLRTAQWLVEQGARQLVLLGRHAPAGEAQVVLQGLRQQGADVRTWQVDVADRDQLAAIFDTMKTTLPPLRGIIHAAGVLDDGVIVQQDRARFEKVFGPKVQGAWNLHLLTQSLPLDFFVLFSSTSAVLGSVGQSNYAAANAFMDALAHDRRARGLPALSINWGAWAEVGMATALDERDKRRLQRSGFGLIAPHAGLQMLAQLLRSNHTQLIAVPIDWPQLLQAIGPEHIPPLLSDRARQVQVTQTARSVRVREDRGVSNAPNDWQQQLAAAAPERRAELIVNYLRRQVARVMGVRAAEALSLDQPLNDLGLDSLMAVEMKNHIESDLGVVVPMVKLLQGPSVAQLAAHVMAQVVALKPATSPEPASAVKAEDQPEAQQLLAQLDQLSDDQVDALLTDLLIAEGQPDE
jgi:NAD(P)-dependent dehydrogenase (short-subunit alcohol dehydrogenase family)/acyl carrier protein